MTALSLDIDTVTSQASEVCRVRDPWLERRLVETWARESGYDDVRCVFES